MRTTSLVARPIFFTDCQTQTKRDFNQRPTGVSLMKYETLSMVRKLIAKTAIIRGAVCLATVKANCSQSTLFVLARSTVPSKKKTAVIVATLNRASPMR